MSTPDERATWKALTEAAREACEGQFGTSWFAVAVPALLADVERLERILKQVTLAGKKNAEEAARLRAENRQLRKADL